MEPVFMILGQTSATAAVLAIQGETSLQAVSYAPLREQLLKDGQVLDLPPQSVPKIMVSKTQLKGVVLDDADAVLQGNWTSSSSSPRYVGSGYLHDSDSEKGMKSATWTLTAPQSGQFVLNLSYSPGSNRSEKVTVVIRTGDQESALTINQKEPPKIDGLFHPLLKCNLRKGEMISVVIGNQDSTGHVIVDALQLLSVSEND
jgi:hypothetical protein